MNIVLIQVLLILVVVLVAARLFRSRGERSQALRRIGLVALAGFAVVSILFPNVWNRIATVVGVGRGTDVVLYALVVAFLSSTVTTYIRFRDMETSYTRLARRIALDEAAAARSSTAPPAPEASPDGAGDGEAGEGVR
jgi:hypothetical protein